VWELLTRLDALQDHDPAIAKATRLPGATTGAARQCDLRAGGWFRERVTVWEQHRALAFELGECTLPVRRLRHHYTLTPEGSGTRVEQHMEYALKYGILGRALDAPDAERDVEVLLDQVDAAAREDDLDPHLWPGARVLDHDPAHEGVAEDGVGGDAEPAARRPVGVTRRAVGLPGQAHDLGAPGRVGRAGFGQVEPPRRPMQEAHAEGELERATRRLSVCLDTPRPRAAAVKLRASATFAKRRMSSKTIVSLMG
jgi:hypothetical protein